MAKIQVKNLKELENVLKAQLNDNKFFTSHLQDKSAEIMSERIKENVYKAFTPSEYERRGDDEGFSDPSGIQFTDMSDTGNGLLIKLENMNTGNDSMEGKTLTDMVENGGNKGDWVNPYVRDAYGRVVSKKRPFIQSTIDDMNQNKGELIEALRKDLNELGFKTK